MAAVKKIQPFIELLAKLKEEHDINRIRYEAAPLEGDVVMLQATFNIIKKLEQAISEAETQRKGGNNENSK